MTGLVRLFNPKRSTALIAIGLLWATAVSMMATATEEDVSVATGSLEFAARCAPCHGSTLGGGQHAPPLIGQLFQSNWAGKSARSLYSRVISTMPQDDPGSLTPAQTLSITLFIFARNSIVLGDRSITSANDLDGVTIAVAPSAAR